MRRFAHLLPAIALFTAALLPSLALADGAPRRFALVVGENIGLEKDQPLQFADDDARRVADVLTSIGGVGESDLMLHESATPETLLGAIEEMQTRLAAQADPERDELFVYISSHASEGKLHLDGGRLDMAEVRKLVDAAPVAVALLVLDACQSGSITRKGLVPDLDSAPRVNVELPPVKGRAIIASTSASEYAQEREDLQGSVFTHHLVAALRGAADRSEDAQVTLQEAYDYTYRHTVDATYPNPQHPTFKFEIEGERQPVLTDFRDVSGRLSIEVPEPGQWLVRSSDGGNFLAQFEKGQGAVTFAVPPGQYKLRMRDAKDQALEGQVEVPASGTGRIATADMRSWVAVKVTPKGAAGAEASPSTAELTTVRDHRTGAEAFWRSLLLPGWGQFYKDRPGHGAIAIASIVPGLAMVGAGVAFHFEHEKWRERYRTATADDLKSRPRNDCGPDVPVVSCTIEHQREEAESAAELRNLMLGVGVPLFLGGYIYNIVNAATIEPGEPELALPVPMVSEDSAGLVWSMRF